MAMVLVLGRRLWLLLAAGLVCGAGVALAQSARSSAVTAHLCWANSYYGTIVEANLNGTGAKTIAKGQEGPGGLAVGP